MRVRRPQRRSILATVGVVLVLATGGITADIVGHAAADSAAHAAAVAERSATRAAAAERRAIDAQQLAHAVQRNRRQAIIDSCHATNQRHNATVRQLHQLIHDAERRAKTARRRGKIRRSVAPTLLLINALAPRRDCEQLARRYATPHG